MTTWTINGRFLSQPVTGVQRYAREVTAAIDRHIMGSAAPHPHMELLVPPDARDLPGYERIVTRTVGHLAGHLWEQLELPLHARGPLLSLANTGPIAKRDHIVCIHDANTRVIPESYARSFRMAYRVLHPALGRAAHTVATVSRHAAADLARYRIASAAKITVAYNGADHAARWIPRHTEATSAAAGPTTIVLLGSPAPHKNIRVILDLAPTLAVDGFRIAVVGMSATVFADAAPHQTPHPSITLLGRISDDALASLLRDSLCLAFPSLTEGFGLPPLEAMMHDCPVIASTAASIPEICGDAALYADPHTPDAWLAAIRRLRDNHDLRAAMIARGRARAAAFTWDATARVYLAALRDVAEHFEPYRPTPPTTAASPVRTSPD